jgi:hypothetical protein
MCERDGTNFIFKTVTTVKIKWTNLDVKIGSASRLYYMCLYIIVLGSETGTDRMESLDDFCHIRRAYIV